MPAARAVAAPDKDTLAVNEAPRKAVHEAAEHRTEQSGDPDEDRRLHRSEDVEREGQGLFLAAVVIGQIRRHNICGNFVTTVIVRHG